MFTNRSRTISAQGGMLTPQEQIGQLEAQLQDPNLKPFERADIQSQLDALKSKRDAARPNMPLPPPPSPRNMPQKDWSAIGASQARQSMQAGALVGGLLGAGKNLVGQLFDDQKGVNIGQVAKAGLAGAAGTIPGVGGMAANMIQGAGQPAAPGAAAFNPYMNNPYQQKNGGMNGVRLMKRGGYNSGVISAQGGTKTPNYFQSLLSGLSPEDAAMMRAINKEVTGHIREQPFWYNPKGQKITEGGGVDVTELEKFGGFARSGAKWDPLTPYGASAEDTSMRAAISNPELFSEGFDPELTYESYWTGEVAPPRDEGGWNERTRGEMMGEFFDIAKRRGVYQGTGGDDGGYYGLQTFKMSPELQGAYDAYTGAISSGINPWAMTAEDVEAKRAGKQAIGGRAPQGVISAQVGSQTPDPTGTIPASDFRLHLRDGEREFYRVNPEGGFSYVGPQSEVMKLIDPDQKVGFFRDVLGYEQVGDNKYFPIGNDIQKARALQEQQDIAFGEELRRDPAYRSAITREATEFAKKGAPLDMTPSEQAFSFVLQGLRDQASERAGKQFAGGRAPIQAKRGVRVINGYGN